MNGRKKIVFTGDEFVEAVKIVREKYGRVIQKHVASELGVSYPTYLTRRVELELDVKTVGLTEKDPDLSSLNLTEEDMDRWIDEIEEKKKKSSYDLFEYQFDESILLKMIGDVHLGSDTMLYKQFWEDVKFIKKTPNCKVILLGDYIDNFTKFSPGSAVYDQLLPPAEQKIKIEWLVRYMGTDKVLGIVQGCFLKGTSVVADDYTMKPIETINKVLGSNKEYDVKHHWQNNYHKGDICRISYLGNTVLDIPATDNHPFLAIKREDIQCSYREKGRFCKGINTGKFCEDRCNNKPKIKPKEILAGDLKVGDLLYIPKAEDPKGNKFSEEDMKIFGWYLAEGSIIPEKATTCFSFGIKDKKYAQEIQKIIEKNHSDKISSTKLKERKERNTIPLNVYGKKFTEWIEKNCGRYSHSKKLNVDVIKESNKNLEILIKHFGYGDGHERDSNGKDITLTTISEDLAWQLWNILLRIGQFASIRQQNRNNRKYNDFQINYKPNRKQFRFCEIEDGYFVPITKIEKEKYEGTVKNLWIDSEEHLYRAGGCIQLNCHDEWSYRNDTFELGRYLAEKIDVPYLGFGGNLHLHVGENLYKLYLSHDDRYFAKQNLTHGLKRAWREEESFNLGISAHRHRADYEEFVEKGQVVKVMKISGYKARDRFLRQKKKEKHLYVDQVIVLLAEKVSSVDKGIVYFTDRDHALRFI